MYEVRLEVVVEGLDGDETMRAWRITSYTFYALMKFVGTEEYGFLESDRFRIKLDGVTRVFDGDTYYSDIALAWVPEKCLMAAVANGVIEQYPTWSSSWDEQESESV